MRKTESKEINGITYSVTQMDARKALSVQIYLLKICAPVLNSEIKKNANIFDLTSLLPDALEKLDTDELENFIVSMCEQAFKDKVRVRFDDFVGDLLSAYELVYFVLEVNFSNFIKDVLAMFTTAETSKNHQ